MPLDVEKHSIVEAIVAWVFVTTSLACYIFVPSRLSLPNHLEWSLSEPTWRPLKSLWARLPDQLVQDLRTSTRWPLARIWAACLVIGASLCVPTVTLWATGRYHAASWCLFSWKAFVTCCLTVVEILQVLRPASQALVKRLSADQKWAASYFPSSLGIHAIWLIVGAWRAELQILSATPMLTHFFSAVAAIYILTNIDRQRVRWWTFAVCSTWLISCSALLATISGWRVGHYSLQCACASAILWERAAWRWRGHSSECHPSQECGGDDGNESVRSTTKLVKDARNASTSIASEDDKEKRRAGLDALIEYLTDIAGRQFDSTFSRSFDRVLEICPHTSTWAKEIATLCPAIKVVAVSDNVTNNGPENLHFPLRDLEKPCQNVNELWRDERWPELGDGGYDYIRLAFLDGTVPDWRVVVNKASEWLNPGGIICVTDVQVYTDYQPYVLAEHRMRAHTSCACDALKAAGFQIDDRCEERSLQYGEAIYNGRDVFGAVVQRRKEFFDQALEYSPGTGTREELLTELGRILERKALVQIVRITARRVEAH